MVNKENTHTLNGSFGSDVSVILKVTLDLKFYILAICLETYAVNLKTYAAISLNN